MQIGFQNDGEQTQNPPKVRGLQMESFSICKFNYFRKCNYNKFNLLVNVIMDTLRIVSSYYFHLHEFFSMIIMQRTMEISIPNTVDYLLSLELIRAVVLEQTSVTKTLNC